MVIAFAFTGMQLSVPTSGWNPLAVAETPRNPEPNLAEFGADVSSPSAPRPTIRLRTTMIPHPGL